MMYLRRKDLPVPAQVSLGVSEEIPAEPVKKTLLLLLKMASTTLSWQGESWLREIFALLLAGAAGFSRNGLLCEGGGFENLMDSGFLAPQGAARFLAAVVWDTAREFCCVLPVELAGFLETM